MDDYKLINYKYGKLYHHKDDNDSLVRTLITTQKYQDWIVKQAKDLFDKKKNKKEFVIIDIGANIGSMTCGFAKFSTKVYAFEPVSSTFKALQGSVKINNLTNVKLFNCALGNENSMKEININNKLSGASSFYQELNGTKETVEIKKLDSFNFDRIDFIKMDVQEGEYDVLLGGIQTIKKHKCPLLVEMPTRNEREIALSKKITKLLRKLSYKITKKTNKDVLFVYDKDLAK